jgi:hypothetical protein
MRRLLEILDASYSRSRFSLDSEVTAIPITLASETYMDMLMMAVRSGVWTESPPSNFRRYLTIMDNVLDPLVSGFGS